MSIEVRQMVVKSSVLQGPNPATGSDKGGTPQAWIRMKADLLAQFQQMIVDAMSEQQER